MSNKKPNDQFEELVIPRKELPKLTSHYRVYSDATNFIVVEAENAIAAMKASAMQQVYRIVRDSIYLAPVLNLEKLANNPPPAAAAEQAPPAAAATDAAAPPQEAAAAPAPASAPAAETPLSTADVDKLLKGENATSA